MKKYRPLLRRTFVLGAGFTLMTLAALAMRLFALLPPPQAPAYRVTGAAKPLVDVIEYSDFQCPSCRMANLAVRNIMAHYPDKVRISFQHMPLNMHAMAVPAASAAECAGKEGKFWEYGNLLFERQRDWATSPRAGDTFVSYAKDLGLNTNEFAICMTHPRTREAINAAALAGDYRGIPGTPAFVINGRMYFGLKAFVQEMTRLGVGPLEDGL